MMQHYIYHHCHNIVRTVIDRLQNRDAQCVKMHGIVTKSVKNWTGNNIKYIVNFEKVKKYECL